ncbi:MAG: hypothetical protein B6I26_05355 [Desulfobacteraceae bacterium 4572_130]|nr:MAG: hypothetical protein B6I26_05355 [Desulfobacteraceae bacterium 4572_130]
MFKGMPKIFWIGMGIMYGWVFFFMFLEMIIPGLPLKQFLGVPACYIYNWIMGLWIINIFISYLFYSSEEKREEIIKNRKGAK